MELSGVRSIKGLDLVPRTPRIGDRSKPRLGHSAGFCLAAYAGEKPIHLFDRSKKHSSWLPFVVDYVMRIIYNCPRSKITRDRRWEPRPGAVAPSVT